MILILSYKTVALTVKRGRRDASWLITIAEISQQIAALAKPFAGNQTILMIVLMIIVVIVGTALDMTPTILILTPILMPIVKQAGIDPVYFGVLFIINNAIGLQPAGRRGAQRGLRRLPRQHG